MSGSARRGPAVEPTVWKIPAMQDMERKLTERIAAVDPELLTRHPIDAYIGHFEGIRNHDGYHYLPPAIEECCRQIEQRTSRSTLEDYHKLLLLKLIEGFEERAKTRNIPESVVSLTTGEFRRIVSRMATNPKGFYVYPNDPFEKDLGICRLKLVPCGAQLVDVRSGVPRSALFKGGPRQFLKALSFFVFHVGGFKPLYELHLHMGGNTLREFNPRGWDRCYVRIAKLLERNPQVKGIFYSTWWTDPRMATISPNLAYLRERPESNGARFFYDGSNAVSTENAIRLSEERRKLYEAGEYTPADYMLVWARKDLIRWAKNFEESRT